jgi:ferritin-like protein
LRVREAPALGGTVPAGDIAHRVGVAELRSRGVDVRRLLEELTAAAVAELAAHYRRTVLASRLAGHGAAGALAGALARQSREHFEACIPRIGELGGLLPESLDTDGEPLPSEPAEALADLLEAERAGIHAWWALCDLTDGRDYRTCALAQRVLGAKIENEAALIDALSAQRSG